MAISGSLTSGLLGPVTYGSACVQLVSWGSLDARSPHNTDGVIHLGCATALPSGLSIVPCRLIPWGARFYVSW